MKKLLVLTSLLLISCKPFNVAKAEYEPYEKCVLKIADNLKATEYSYTYQELLPATEEYDFQYVIDFYEWQPSDTYSKWICLMKEEVIDLDMLYIELR